MDCPACRHELSSFELDDVVVDVCRQACGGVWFDNRELEKVDEAHEHQGEPLLYLETEHDVEVDHDRRRRCPRCPEALMMRHFFSVKERVEIDRCPTCNGTWLDLGELRQIRTLFPTEADRQRATKEHFEQLFRHDLAEMRAESQQEVERARRFARLFRFLCPSYYIPGKQDWGAF
jgi:hypothetical protein